MAAKLPKEGRSMKFSLKKTAWALAAAGLILLPWQAKACTLFAAQGSAVEGGGAIIVKNRDEHPMYQEMRYHQGHVYRYYGIYGGNEDHMSLTGGVNEAGFAVFSAVAEPIPKDVRLPPTASAALSQHSLAIAPRSKKRSK